MYLDITASCSAGWRGRPRGCLRYHIRVFVIQWTQTILIEWSDYDHYSSELCVYIKYPISKRIRLATSCRYPEIEPRALGSGRVDILAVVASSNFYRLLQEPPTSHRF